MKQCSECGEHSLTHISCTKCGNFIFRLEPTKKSGIWKRVCDKCNSVEKYLTENNAVVVTDKEIIKKLKEEK